MINIYMPTITLLNLIALTAFIVIMFFGIVIITRHTQVNTQQRVLRYLLGFWIFIMVQNYTRLLGNGPVVVLPTTSLNIRTLLAGIPCFFALISYPIVAIHPRILKLKNCLLLTSPLIVLVVAYFALHAIMGLDPLYTYNSIGDVWQNIGSVTVISRLVLTAIFIAYITCTLHYIYQLASIYDEYAHGNYADSAYNVTWLKRLAYAIAIISTCYFIVLFHHSPYTSFVYLCSTATVFYYIIDNAIYSQEFQLSNEIKTSWSIKRGLHLDASVTDKDIERISHDRLNQIEKSIFDWILKEKAYLKVDFSTADIIEKFPNINREIISRIFKRNNISFQTYVRDLRISEACKIIDKKPNTILSKQLYSRVGFSHYSSFARAFIAIVGKGPSEYIDERKNRHKTLKDSLLGGGENTNQSQIEE